MAKWWCTNRDGALIKIGVVYARIRYIVFLQGITRFAEIILTFYSNFSAHNSDFLKEVYHVFVYQWCQKI